jgi:type IV secretion system protein TrbG
MRHTTALGVVALLPLAACAPETPQISYDDPAALRTEPPKPVKIVQMPELLPLPGQLKRMPRGGQPASASEPRDPARRVQLANAAASVKPTRAGYVNATRSTHTATGRCTSSTSLRCTSLTSPSSPARS